MSKFLLICLCILFLCFCGKNSNGEYFEIENGNIVNGYKSFHVKSSDGILFNFYLDKDGEIVEISDTMSQKFRIIFDKDEMVQFVENRFSKLKKRSFQFDNLTNKFVITDDNDKMFRELRIFGLGATSPSVDYMESRLHDKMYFLSQYASFDFNSWRDPSPRSRENIVLMEKPEKLYVNQQSIWKFEICSIGNKYSLLNSNWDYNFNSKGNIDTFQIEKSFTYTFSPSQEYDTIRFVLLCENVNNDQHKSIYYQLPIKCR